ncbi:MAG: TIGR02449 family protein [Candidatus Competibacter sp.]|nr:TIGR02449 family protein [Candidatus Competibacter sp.]MDG4583465.1 TIGR02449 family protein [Candidatus Competibacter sp.]
METDELHETVAPAEVSDLENIPETAATGLAILAERLDRVAALCERLKQDKRFLREQNRTLQAECAALREQNEQSRSRIEAMIVRLKGLEQAS